MTSNARFPRLRRGPSLALAALLLASSAGRSQTASACDPDAAFDPGFLAGPATGTRSASGAPGPGCWLPDVDRSNDRWSPR